jgi:hypothetical protein
MSNFWSPSRKAPGFPVGCVEAGDMLANIAGRDITILIITTALRSAIESTGDPARGLAKVRAALAVAGSRLPTPWCIGYYGKELVAVLPGGHSERVVQAAAAEAAITEWPSPHGWAWIWVSAPTLSARLEACYRASVAARVRRDHPYLRASEASSVLEEWRSGHAQPPEIQQIASMLAAVLVRPYGTADMPVSRLGDDPRWPGVRSADGLNRSMMNKSSERTDDALYIISDVHDIEWARSHANDSQAPGADQQSGGNATRLLHLAHAWVGGRVSIEVTLMASYKDRLAREQMLATHLRDLGTQRGELFGTLGDGLEGIAESQAGLIRAVSTANARPWHLHSGVGAARISDEAGGFEDQSGIKPKPRPSTLVNQPNVYAEARNRALFSLHLTKVLKYGGSQHADLHVYGTALSSRDQDTVLSFLKELRDNGRGTSGYHHLRHAQAHSQTWRRHLSRESYSAFQRIISCDLRAIP